MKSLTVVTSLAIVPSVGAASQPSPSAALDRFLAQHLAEIPNPGFSVSVVRNGRVVFEKGYGVAVVGQRRPMTTQSPVAIGSLTKSFTAVAIMRLVERGKVDLDAPVVKYLPWFTTADRRGSAITVRMLLHNTSGIPSQDRVLTSLDTDEGAIEREVRSLSRVSLARAPGKSFEYSNENWTVLGAIITAVTGLPYSTFMEREVLGPLGMRHSSTALARFGAIGALEGHIATPTGVIPAKLRFLAGALPAGSELRVSAQDMSRYLQMLLALGNVGTPRFLREESVRTLFVPGSVTTVSMPEMGVLGGQSGYAMGWVINEADGRTLIHHGGDAVVMGSWTAIDTITKTAATVLYNGPSLDPYRYPSRIWLVNNMLHIAAGQPLSDFGRPKETDPTTNDYELPVDRLDRYVGTYLSAEGQRLTVTKAASGDRLLLDMQSGALRYLNEVDFVNEATAVLRNISAGVVTTFLMTPDGRVTGLSGGVPGGVFRKPSAAELAKVQEVMAPSGLMTIQLPRGWTIRWTGDSFEARDGADTATTIRGSLVRGGEIDSLVPMPGARERTEAIGRLEWREYWWTDGNGSARRQRMAATATEGGATIRLHAATRVGGMTMLVRDALVPLMTALELKVR